MSKRYKRIISNLKKAHNWEGMLKSANDLFFQGGEKAGKAVKEYGKILELLLRDFYKEIHMIIPQEKRTEISQAEQKIGKGKKPIGKFGFGQLISLFSKSSLFKIVRELSGIDVLDSRQLNRVNEPRIDQTHYDEEAIKDEVDKVRKYTTKVLLKLELIEKDPDEPLEIRRQRMDHERDLEKRRKRMEKLRRLLDRIRSGLVGKSSIEQNYEITDDFGDKYYHIEVEAEVVGIYLSKDETFTVLVRADWLAGHEDVMEEMYDKVAREVRDIIEKIEPKAKENLNILIFDDLLAVEKAATWEYWAKD